jgi:phosphoglucomutase
MTRKAKPTQETQKPYSEKAMRTLLARARKELSQHIRKQYEQGQITKELYQKAAQLVVKNLIEWATDRAIFRISPNTRWGILEAIERKRWDDLTEAFMGNMAFGTAGIRGRAALVAFDEDVKASDPQKREADELDRFAAQGVDARILKGPNTINNITLLQTATGVARYAADRKLKSVAIGYDSRLQGATFAELIAQCFLYHGIKVYLFDEACPFPELAFAVPDLGADLGILISASHNDKRYNGFKLTGPSGAQINMQERNIIYQEYISRVKSRDIHLKPFEKATKRQLVFLGGAEKLEGVNYYGKELIDMHKRHINHIEHFIMDREVLREWAPRVKVGYAAFYGAGHKAVPRLLKDFGFETVSIVDSLHSLDGRFPCFKVEQQPDPGDDDAAEIAVREFIKQYGQKQFDEIDILIGTDPDADRTGIVIKIPSAQRQHYRGKSYRLLEANDAWTLLVWYRLKKEAERSSGAIPNASAKFIAISHTTTEALVNLARKYGIGVLQTWVGFGFLSEAVRRVWYGMGFDRTIMLRLIDMNYDRTFNVATLEQSNGFSILGGIPPSERSLGKNGHVRDKDGTFAAILFAEVAAYAKSRGTTIFDLLDEEIYLDPDIGYYATCYAPAPKWGQYEGLEGISRKIAVLKEAQRLMERVHAGEEVELGGLRVINAEQFQTGKYDALHYLGFPDEGVRFYFDRARQNHLLIRPSGTSQCLRFHSQIKAEGLTRENIGEKKAAANRLARQIIADVRAKLGVSE